MAEPEDKKSFWNTMPGILTGIAATITALVGAYVAISQGGSVSPGGSVAPPGSGPGAIPPPVVDTTSPKEWPKVLEETFTKDTVEWPFAVIETSEQSEIGTLAGNYRWDIVLVDGGVLWAEAPYGSLVDFYAAVDVTFLAFDENKLLASGIRFGESEGTAYGFWIGSDGSFALTQEIGGDLAPTQDVDSQENERSPEVRDEYDKLIVSWTPIKINEGEPNRLTVSVDDQQIEMFVNDAFVGVYKDPNFKGGKVGLAVVGWEAQSAVVDFDNFELRRGP